MSLFVAVSLWHAEQLLFSCVCLKVRICNYVECHMLHFTCHMLYVTCLCWSSAHTEQLLFSCVSSKVSICKGDGIYAELGAEPIFITSIFFFLLIIGTESGNGCSTAHEWSWKDFFANINMKPETMLRSSTMKSSMKSSTTPWEPVALFLGFMLMLAKNPFRTIHKHPYPLCAKNHLKKNKKYGSYEYSHKYLH